MRYLYIVCAISLIGCINNANATYNPFEDPQYQKQWMGNVFGMHQWNGKPELAPIPKREICIEGQVNNYAPTVACGTDSDEYRRVAEEFKSGGFGNFLLFERNDKLCYIHAAFCGSGFGKAARTIDNTMYYWDGAGARILTYKDGKTQFVRNWCTGNTVIQANMMQPHMYDKYANELSLWQCVCNDSSGSAGCGWKLLEPETKCDTVAGYIYVPKNGGNLPKEWLQVSPQAFMQCGKSKDETEYLVKHETDDATTYYDISRAKVTYRDASCPNNAEYVTLIPQTHLNDNVGGQKWQCECVRDDCAWKRVGEIPTCTVQNSPYKNLTAVVAGLTTGERHKIFDKYDDNQINKFLAGPTNGTPILMNMSDETDRNGYRYYFGSYKEISDKFCVSKTCKTKHDDLDHQPDKNYEKCIEQRPCQIGFDRNASLVPVGQRGNNYCHEQTRASIPRVTSTDPAYNIIKDNVPHDSMACEYLCTPSGWAVRLLPRSNACNDGYMVAPNWHECISESEVRKRLCEKSGGTFSEIYRSGSVHYNCDPPNEIYPFKSVSYEGSEYIYFDICRNPNQLYNNGKGKSCINKNDLSDKDKAKYFDAQNPEKELEKIMQGMQTWNATSGTESTSGADATSTMAATDTTASISDLAGRLALVEGQFGLSKWRTAEGKFNTARLASDLTAGVVLGTTGALVTSSVVKKKQVKDGFESLECTVGGQHVGDWGDVFRIDGK